ncbi:MAG: hypothetical protein NVS4B11_10590 [Ktedonobacteraceae bacterium]
MDAVLNGLYGPMPLDPNVTVLGRTQDNQIVVNDNKASSHHAEIRAMGQDYTITDLGSTNGTFVNGLPLAHNMPRRLLSGDTVRIGDTTYTFEIHNAQQPGFGIYGNQGTSSNPGFAPTQMARPQYPGTAYGSNPANQSYPPTQPAADYQQGGFQPYPGQQNSFPPPPPLGSSSFNQYNQSASATAYTPPQYNPVPVPGAYPPVQGGIPPYAPPPPPRKRGSGLRTIILVGLALLVIIGAATTFFVVHNNQVATDHAQGTATALTAIVHSNATAITQATGTAEVNATATAGAQGGDGPYTNGTIALDDALKDNTGGHQWQEDSNCAFTQQVYEIKESRANTFRTCFAQSTNFSNFAYRVALTILAGDCSGIAFRGDVNSNKQYYYEMCQAGTYDLVIFDGNSGKYLIKPTSGSAINSGIGKANVIAVFANNDTIQLYANGTLLDTVQDATFTSGSIGLLSVDHTSSTDVVYANAKVWTM